MTDPGRERPEPSRGSDAPHVAVSNRIDESDRTIDRVPRASLATALGLDADRVARTVAALERRGWTIATAESLTAGLLTAVLTSVPGSSAVVRGGIVCYATDLKAALVGVDPELLARVGPVDPDVARQLAEGARTRCAATIGVGLTGVAGPASQGGRPPGTVFVAVATPSGITCRPLPPVDRQAGRAEIRAASIQFAFALVDEVLAGS